MCESVCANVCEYVCNFTYTVCVSVCVLDDPHRSAKHLKCSLGNVSIGTLLNVGLALVLEVCVILNVNLHLSSGGGVI